MYHAVPLVPITLLIVGTPYELFEVMIQNEWMNKWMGTWFDKVYFFKM